MSYWVEPSLLWVFRIVGIAPLHHLGQCILGIQISYFIFLEFKFITNITVGVFFIITVAFSFKGVYFFFFILSLRCRWRDLFKVRVLRIVKFEIWILFRDCRLVLFSLFFLFNSSLLHSIKTSHLTHILFKSPCTSWKFFFRHFEIVDLEFFNSFNSLFPWCISRLVNIQL